MEYDLHSVKCRMLIVYRGYGSMLIKIDNGFYLNSQHIIAVRIVKGACQGQFEVTVEYTPHATAQIGLYKKYFDSQHEAEMFLQELNQRIK